MLGASLAAFAGLSGQALAQDVVEEEEIVITAWSPHWMFAKYDLKYLEDPQETFGSAENIHTIARYGFEEDQPEAFAIVDAFEWTQADMEAVMLDINQGMSPEEAAQKWVKNNSETVSEWTK